MLELEGIDSELVTILDSSTDSANWREGYRPSDVANLSGHEWVASILRAGVTILEEWQTCILERGFIYPF